MNSIEIILKISERCNINCDYCYMFNLGNEDYKNNPKFIHKKTIENLINFIKQGVFDLKLSKVDIILHGGEPLLLGKNKFSYMCDLFIKELSQITTLRLRLQTNAILITQAWIDIFKKYNIYTGVSIDGPEEYNDQHRIDHKGKGTYKKILRGINRLQVAANNNEIADPGVLIVINPKFSGKATYEHIIKELNFNNVNFLLPMLSYETSSTEENKNLTNYLLDLANAHIYDGHELAKVRIVNQFANFIKNEAPLQNNKTEKKHYIIGISSSGQLDVDDEFKTIENKYSSYSIFNSSLNEFITSSYFQNFMKISKTLPYDCQDCCWKNYCVGGSGIGSTLSRYSKKNNFNNKSVFCQSLRKFYTHTSWLMLKMGLPKNKLEEVLSEDRQLKIHSIASEKQLISIHEI